MRTWPTATGTLRSRRATDPRAQRVGRLGGVGVLSASAVAATVLDPGQFRCGRQFAAWVGLTPPAIANKHARLIWVLLTRDEPLRAHAAVN